MRRFSLDQLSKLPSSEFRITFSTVLTVMRIILTPCIVSAMVWGSWGVAYGLFLVAAVSDMLDGALARMLNQKTFLGACLDPIADKLLLVSCFTTLAFTHRLPFEVPFWFVGMVLLRELVMVFGFVYLFTTTEGVDVRPTLLGKVTAAGQMLFIAWLFTCYFYKWVPTQTYYLCLASVTVLIIISFIQYAAIGWDYYRKG